MKPIRDEQLRKLQLSSKENEDVLVRAEYMVDQRISELLRHVSFVFPIQRANDQCHWIRSLPIPEANSGTFEEDAVATALGFTTHCVALVAKYLQLPLRYPMLPRSSRSMIYDYITTFRYTDTCEFPLYSKNVEQFKYDYAVFLLNKNIEQVQFWNSLVNQLDFE
jgi:UV radiation resistance-associated gene protein